MNDKLASALAELAQKLGTTVEHLWPVMIAQAKLEAAVSLYAWLSFQTFVAILGLSCWGIWIYGKKVVRKPSKYHPGDFTQDTRFDENGWHFGAIIFVCVFLIGLAVGVLGILPDYYMTQKNPEYYALRYMRHATGI